MNFLVTKIGLVALLPLMIIFEWWVEPVVPIDEAHFVQIQKGMSKKEVEKLLGPLGSREVQGNVFRKTEYTTEIWDGRGCAIVVFFANGVVTGKHFFQPPLSQLIDDWIHERYRHPDGGVSKRLEKPA
jgi:hypothetical protein